MKMKKVSIVMVTFNASNCVELTIQSVLNQIYSDYEYIVMDGGSTDGTIDILSRYKQKFTYLVSEPDNGIYDAMNKAIGRANGEWIIFMNAGDSFANNHVLSDVFSMSHGETDVIYGDSVGLYSWGEVHLKARFFSERDINLPFCHQSTLVRTKWMKQYKFDLKYKVAADYNFFHRLFVEGKSFEYINIPIAKFEMGGFSSKRVLQTYQEVTLAADKSHDFMYYYIWMYLWVRSYLMLLIPNCLVNAVRKSRYT